MMRLTKLFFIFISCSLHGQHYFPFIDSYVKDTLVQGDCFRGYFTFVNQSHAAIKIMDVTGSTDNLIAYTNTRNIIHPGDTARIDFSYNSASKLGAQTRPISVYLSNDSVINFTLHIVVEPAGSGAPQIERGRLNVYQSRDSLIGSNQNDSVNPVVISKHITNQTQTQTENLNNHAAVVRMKKFMIPPDVANPQEDQIIIQPKDSCNCDLSGPVFPGGPNAFTDTVLVRSYRKAKPTLSGKCYIEFTIDANGILKDPVVKKSIDPEFEKVLIKEMIKAGKWTPACRTEGLFDDEGGMDGNSCASSKYTMPFVITK